MICPMEGQDSYIARRHHRDSTASPSQPRCQRVLGLYSYSPSKLVLRACDMIVHLDHTPLICIPSPIRDMVLISLELVLPQRETFPLREWCCPFCCHVPIRGDCSVFLMGVDPFELAWPAILLHIAMQFEQHCSNPLMDPKRHCEQPV